MRHGPHLEVLDALGAWDREHIGALCMQPRQCKLTGRYTLLGRQLLDPLHQCKVGLQRSRLEARLPRQPPVILTAKSAMASLTVWQATLAYTVHL